MSSILLTEAAEKIRPLIDALPPSDRVSLADYIWESIHGEAEGTPEEIRAAWKVEIMRRLDEIKSGKVEPVPIEEMFRKSREKHP